MPHEDLSSAIALTFLSGPRAGQHVLIEQQSVTIGRDLANDVVISSDRQVSRRHARLSWDGDHWRIDNLSQGNITQVNGQDVQSAELNVDDTINLGAVTSFTVSAPGDMNTLSADAVEPIADQSALPSLDEELQASRVTSPPTANTSAATEDRVEATELARMDEGNIPSLTVTSNTRGDKGAYPLVGKVINIGRDASNDIVINDRIVSAQHLQIVSEGTDYVLIHPHPARESTLNGLYYQGQKIRGDERFVKTLAKGDVFRIGDENGTLVTLAYHDGSDTEQIAAPPIEPIMLGADEITIGRLADNTIVLTHPQVSAHHAVLTREDATYRIVDLHSTNHVYVNSEIISSHSLKMGDEIRIGPFRFIYDGRRLKQYDESNFIRIDAMNLKKLGHNNVTLLDDITLSIPPRSFVALVGGSGAGKSTLMDALNGLRPAQVGAVLYNGRDYYRNITQYSAQIGYVPQDDIVHRDLTVERALYYAAKLRLPGDYTEEQIAQRVNEALEEVELTHRRSLMVRDLSGGQRKRVSIALELLANPSVFFLDEPTSGLDPGLDRKMMFLLRRLADRGHTIVLVTHATNNINSCDYVCFLCAGGRLAYFGPPEQAKVYFGKADFAEIYTSLEPTDAAPEIPAEADARFRASPEYQRYVVTPTRKARDLARDDEAPPAPQRRAFFRRGRGWSQFLLLSSRYLELLKNDSVNLMILLLQAPIVALLLVLMLRFETGAGIFNANSITQCRTQIVTASGPIALPQARQGVVTDCQNAVNFLRESRVGEAYAQANGGVNHALQNFMAPGPGADAQKALFIMAFATILFGCINGAREIVKEAPIYRRERAVNLGIAPYMFSKIAILGLLCLAQSAALLLIVQLGEPLQQGIFTSPLVESYITLSLTALAGLMIGLAISAIAPNTDRAMSFVPIILLPQVIFSGAIIPLKDWLTQLVAAAFPSRWGMAALGSTVGLHADNVGGDRLFGSDYTYHGTLYSIYSQADATGRLTLSWIALAVITLLLVIVTGVFLKRKDAQQ